MVSRPGDDPRLSRIAQFLRDRRPDRIVDGVHALDLASMPVNFGAALVALGEADAAVAGAVGPTRRHDPGGALGDRHRARRRPRELGVLHGAAGRRGAHLHRLRGGARARRRSSWPRSRWPRRATGPGWWATRRGSPSSPTAPREAPRGRGWRACARRRRGSASWRPTSSADGELQADAALVAEVAERKAPGSAAGGARPTCWSFPTSTPATSPTSWCSGWPVATAIGPMLQGLARPMADLSRGATADDIVEVAAMVALQCD